MAIPPKLPPDKELVFMFRGGPENRSSIRFDPPHSSNTDAQVLWAATRMGTIGQQFDWLSVDKKRHRYKVIDKMEESDVVIVLCEQIDGPRIE